MKVTVKIRQDELIDSPRVEMDNLGHMICWHRRHNLGDEHDYKNPEAFIEALGQQLVGDSIFYGWLDEHDEAEVLGLCREVINRRAVILPLVILDHGGIWMRTGTGFAEDPGGWDTSMVGWIYCTRDEAFHEFDKKGWQTLESWVIPRGSDKPITVRKATEKILRSEVEVYTQWLQGDVWWFSIEDEEGNTLDSVGGYYGYDYCVKEVQDILAHHKDWEPNDEEDWLDER